MNVVYFPRKISNEKSILILGSFGSIHNGHLELINVAKEFKKRISVMVIEDTSLLPGINKSNYASLSVRLQQLANLEIAEVQLIHFNESLKLMSGYSFVEKIINATNAIHIVVGSDFACGWKRNYTASDLAKDFSTTIVPIKKINDQKISTTLLKEMVVLGEVDLIKKLSPFPYTIQTEINSKGEFEFKNLKLQKGIYVISAIINEIQYWGYAHLNLLNKNKVVLNKWLKKLAIVEVLISFHKQIRPIVFSKNDEINISDKQKLKQFFSV